MLPFPTVRGAPSSMEEGASYGKGIKALLAREKTQLGKCFPSVDCGGDQLCYLRLWRRELLQTGERIFAAGTCMGKSEDTSSAIVTLDLWRRKLFRREKGICRSAMRMRKKASSLARKQTPKEKRKKKQIDKS
ncbi:hypothetical protein FNV43_RR13127 [Rhamnella rubrinervis]|uniref:Uncharacterized protein n=1 Tax=Rhamnella rubrinervis TaxID=2594499 RepID=A0A8K0H0L5_9ROSA|nr:hypothetical protein FNV43_RR13127 [Rhamnella rubrinervis]